MIDIPFLSPTTPASGQQDHNYTNCRSPMRVIIRDDYEQMSLWVAKYVVKRIKAFNPTAYRPFVLGTYFVCSQRISY
jgi:hypothetical protein